MLREPWITALVQGAVAAPVFRPTWSPVGTELSVRSTVFGLIVTALVSVSPPESVTISLSSSDDGYS